MESAASSSATVYIDIDHLDMASQEPLRQATRTDCPKCLKRMNLYCFDCLVALTDGVPTVNLPVQVDIIQHGETNGHATGGQAAILAPGNVTLIRHEDGSSHHRRQDAMNLNVPDYDPSTTVLLFPGEGIPCIGQPDCPKFERAVLLEGSWQKAKKLLNRHPKLLTLPKVQLPLGVRSIYWRRAAGHFDGACDQSVCTLECVYHMCRAMDPPGNYDNLLWYFIHIRSLVMSQGSSMTKRYLEGVESRRLDSKKLKPSTDQDAQPAQGLNQEGRLGAPEARQAGDEVEGPS